MNQVFYNFLNCPVYNNQDVVKMTLIKQMIVAQVLYVFHTWRQMNQDKEIVFGMIGCGAVGKLIINSIPPFAVKNMGLKKSNVHISTRRPEQIQYYERMGYQVYFDNQKLLSKCNFVILALPPVVDNWNILELQFTDNYVLSILSTISLKRVQQLLKKNNLYVTNIEPYLVPSAIKEYMELQKAGLFQTELLEDITKLIMDHSYKHFFHQESQDTFLSSFGEQVNDELYMKIFGRLPSEQNNRLAFQKTILQFLNFVGTSKK
ncbi:hypothetical protein pb186bvf_015501 [Paramecium bursaria]